MLIKHTIQTMVVALYNNINILELWELNWKLACHYKCKMLTRYLFDKGVDLTMTRKQIRMTTITTNSTVPHFNFYRNESWGPGGKPSGNSPHAGWVGEHLTEVTVSTQSGPTQCPWLVLGQQSRGTWSCNWHRQKDTAASAIVSPQRTGAHVHWMPCTGISLA